jgi:flagellar basal body-associated protein FliL
METSTKQKGSIFVTLVIILVIIIGVFSILSLRKEPVQAPTVTEPQESQAPQAVQPDDGQIDPILEADIEYQEEFEDGEYPELQ